MMSSSNQVPQNKKKILKQKTSLLTDFTESEPQELKDKRHKLLNSSGSDLGIKVNIDVSKNVNDVKTNEDISSRSSGLSSAPL